MSILNNVLDDSQLFPIEFIFGDFKTYYKTIIQTLEKAAKESEDNFSSKVKELGKTAEEEEEKPEYKGAEGVKSGYFECGFKNLYDESRNRTIKFPNYFRSFFLTQICSFTESELMEICKYLHGKKKPTPSFDTTIAKYGKISYTERYLKYLEEYEGLDLSGLENEISDLITATKIRNLIVHNLSIITKTHEKWDVVKTIEEEFHHIKLEATFKKNAYEIIICSDDFIIKTIDNSMHLFEKIFENFRSNNIHLMKSPKWY